MSTQITPSKLSVDDHPWIEDRFGFSVLVSRFIAYPDGRYYVEDCSGDKWFGEGRGRAKLWPYLVTA